MLPVSFKSQKSATPKDQSGHRSRYRGFEFRSGQEISLFSKTSRPALGPIQPPIQRGPEFFPGIKTART